MSDPEDKEGADFLEWLGTNVPYLCIALACAGISSGIPSLTRYPLFFLLGWVCGLYVGWPWMLLPMLGGLVVITSLVR